MAAKKLAIATARTRTFKGTTTTSRSVRSVRKPVAKQSMFSYFNFSESYTSLILGMVLVVIASVFVLSVLRNHGLVSFRSNRQEISATSTQSTAGQTSMSQATPKTYTVAAGDDLWKIAEKVYNNGYNWTDIAKANNLTNPGVLFVGTKLTLPSVTPAPKVEVAQAQPAQTQTTMSQTQTVQPNTASGATYTVVHGDDLWHIAVKKYNNGYKWTEIAKANGLTNPNQIHAGNVLKLP